MSLIPKTQQRKQSSQSEDLELLKLVGAVLDTSNQKQLKPRVALRRMKKALRKQLRNHPVAAVGVLVCFLFLAFFVGFTATSAAQKPAEIVGDGPGYSGPPGSSITSVTTSGTAGGTSGGGRVVDKDLGRRDLALDLLQRAVDGDYAHRSDIATGRFLKDFENQWFLLVDVDRTQIQPARRGTGWVQVRGPYNVSEARHRTHLTEVNQRWKRASEAIIRMVDENGMWKLEHIRVY